MLQVYSTNQHASAHSSAPHKFLGFLKGPFFFQGNFRVEVILDRRDRDKNEGQLKEN